MLLSPNTLQPFNNLRWRNPTMLRRLHNQTLLGEYYNGLIAQGYPHEDAVRYTQQYFAEFFGDGGTTLGWCKATLA